MKQVVLRNVTKQFTSELLGTVTAVNDLTLDIMEGECFSILGPSGCGKTTTLRMIAGFEDLTEGEIELCGSLVSSKKDNLYLPPEKRELGMVFQAFAVWPHMSVFENVAFPLRVRKIDRIEIGARVKQAIKHCNLEGTEREYPGSLSAGQQQRIALARAIVTNPQVMLLDEPLSNLDPSLRESMRFEIKRLQEEFNFTIVFVTHDQSEAMAISDRMMVMDMGSVVQIDTPINLYNRPKTRFVHNFLGESNFTNVILENGRAYVEGDMDQCLPVDFPRKSAREMVLATRPHQIEMKRSDGYKCIIDKCTFLTNCLEYLVRVGNQYLKVQTSHQNEFSKGETCYLRFPAAMWYPREKIDTAEAERSRRQLI